MKALVYLGPNHKALEERPQPALQTSADVIVQMELTSICSSDLHILEGDVANFQPGRILGHEGTGSIVSAGSSVTMFKVGDKVLVSCITACGKCLSCRKQMYSHCSTGGRILGNTIDGTQAEFVRIPHADTSLYHIPAYTDDEAMVMLSDILPTGFECGVLNGKIRPGCTVAIVGAGPVAMATLLTAKFYSPAQIIVIDTDDKRLAVAKKLGATSTLNSTRGNTRLAVQQLTNGLGVDTVVLTARTPATIGLCPEIIAAGGRIANIGVHGVKSDFHLESLWDRNITFTTRLVDTVSTQMLLAAVQSRKVDPKLLITHRFKLDRIMEAYETFSHAAETQALKVIIRIRS